MHIDIRAKSFQEQRRSAPSIAHNFLNKNGLLSLFLSGITPITHHFVSPKTPNPGILPQTTPLLLLALKVAVQTGGGGAGMT